MDHGTEAHHIDRSVIYCFLMSPIVPDEQLTVKVRRHKGNVNIRPCLSEELVYEWVRRTAYEGRPE